MIAEIVIPDAAKRRSGIHNPCAGVMDSGFLASLGPGMTGKRIHLRDKT
jgi:hypothetical protein